MINRLPFPNMVIVQGPSFDFNRLRQITNIHSQEPDTPRGNGVMFTFDLHLYPKQNHCKAPYTGTTAAQITDNGKTDPNPSREGNLYPILPKLHKTFAVRFVLHVCPSGNSFSQHEFASQNIISTADSMETARAEHVFTTPKSAFPPSTPFPEVALSGANLAKS